MVYKSLPQSSIHIRSYFLFWLHKYHVCMLWCYILGDIGIIIIILLSIITEQTNLISTPILRALNSGDLGPDYKKDNADSLAPKVKILKWHFGGRWCRRRSRTFLALFRASPCEGRRVLRQKKWCSVWR